MENIDIDAPAIRVLKQGEVKAGQVIRLTTEGSTISGAVTDHRAAFRVGRVTSERIIPEGWISSYPNSRISKVELLEEAPDPIEEMALAAQAALAIAVGGTVTSRDERTLRGWKAAVRSTLDYAKAHPEVIR